MADTQYLSHGFGPLYSDHAKTLILGSFPSVKSREAQFYYGHPQNRFWRIILALSDPETEKRLLAGEKIEPPETIEEKKALILNLDFALWDTIERCTVTGSSDSSIRDVTVTDIPWILDRTKITRIFCNGATSFHLFEKYSKKKMEDFCQETGRTVPSLSQLPSTSPANAAWSLPKLYAAWKEALFPERT